MLRKAGHIISVLILLAATMGLTVSRHYCGTRLVSVSILSDNGTCCDQEEGCCHEDTDTYKLTVDYTVSQYFIEVTKTFRELPFSILKEKVFKHGNLSDVFISDSPPLRKLQTTLSTYQAYRL